MLRREDWARLERAFLHGASAKQTREPGDGHKVFESCLQTVEAGLPVDQRFRLSVIESRRRHALSAAREGRLHAATALLDEAGSLIGSPATSAFTRAFAEAFLYAVAAYVSYRRQDWCTTYRQLGLALERDDELIAGKVYILEMHRVQIAHNWMRVVARHVGNLSAAWLGVALIEYLRSGGRPEDWPKDVSFASERAVADWAAIPPELVYAMEEQVTCELAVCLARLDPVSHVVPVSRLVHRMMSPVTTAEQFIHLISARTSGQRDAFMQIAPAFLERARGANAFLWEACVFELLRCEDHPAPDDWKRVVSSLAGSWTFLALPDRPHLSVPGV
jgi:hypothetical protein